MLVAVTIAIVAVAVAALQTVRLRRAHHTAAHSAVVAPEPAVFAAHAEPSAAASPADSSAAPTSAALADTPEPGTPIDAAALANIAHEMRTPLTSILGYLKMLRRRGEEMTPEQRAEMVAVCDRLAQRQLRLVESLLESSRLEEGAPLRRERLDLQAIVRETVQGLGSVVGAHNVEMELPSHDLRLFGSPDAIQHALSNLIENAAKYAPAATRIVVSVRESGDEVVVSVADEGPGIPEAELTDIFDRGRRGKDSERPGAGLGLSIVQTLVRAHGGRVWANSSGRGATISFTLPRRASDSLATSGKDVSVLRHGAITQDAARIMRVVR